MTDIATINFTGEYSGLLSSLYVTAGLGSLCLIGFETLRHVPRRRGEQGAKPPKNHSRYRMSKRRARIETEPPRNRPGVFSWEYWRAGRHNNISVTEHNETHELKERNFKKGLKAIGKDGYTDDRSARVNMVQRMLGSRESWEFGYLYENRCWNAIEPAEPLPKWPFIWIYSIIMFPERDLPGRVGLDCTAHSRFLRGALWYIFLHCCTTMVVLTPLHIFYAPDDIQSESMNKAGIRVSQSTSEKRWLWVHVFLLYWVAITWLITLIWVIWGVLMYRKEDIRQRVVALHNEYGSASTTDDRRESMEPEMSELLPGRRSSVGDWIAQEHSKPNTQRSDLVDMTQVDDGEPTLAETGKAIKTLGLDAPGWKRYRTIMVSNIPPAMRDEKHLRYYFSEALHKAPPPKAWKHAVPHFVKKQANRAQAIAGTPKPSMDLSRSAMASMVVGVTDVAVTTGMTLSQADNRIVDDVVLVHKLGELGRLRERREAVIKQLENAHVRLAVRVMNDISKFRDTISSPKTPKRQSLEKLRSTDEDGLIGKNVLLTALEPFMPGCQNYNRDLSGNETLDSTPETIWEALLSVPREYLDPYQPLSHRFDRLHKENLPLIDYLTAKLAVLTERLEKAKAKPLTDYSPSSTAFVTFRTAALARRALQELPSSVLYPLGCQTRPCPHYSDLIWPRLSKSVYRADVVRGWVIGVIIFITTIAWIFPVSALIGLASVGSIAKIFPPFADYFLEHQRLASFVTNTVPVILVASISLSICPLLLVVANKAETLVTGYDVHNAVIHRFWIFQMVNIVIFFVVGRSSVEAYITSRFRPQNVLNNVADAFPTAAPYYASYFLIQTTIQSLAELARVGLPLIFYLFSNRKAITPRLRAFRLAHSTVSWFLQLPNAVLALSICNLFCLYNPLVLPFCFVYLFAANVSYRRSYLYIYGRRYENNGKRNSIRYLRYSLDAMMLTCFSMLAFMILAKERALAALSALLLPIIAFIKIGLTRIIKARFARLRTEEANSIDSLRRQAIGEDVADDNAVMEESRIWRILAQPCRFLDRWFTLKVDHDRDSTLKSEKRPIMPATLVTPLDDEKSSGESSTGRRERVVRRHTYNPYWDDLPSPSRMQRYEHQPWYHDSIETFLWLPRDPMSILDLEDTIELRACITTSDADIGDIWEDDMDVEKMLATAESNYQARNTSAVGTAVDDDNDMADDPDVSLVHRINHRLHRMTMTRSDRTTNLSGELDPDVTVSSSGGLSRNHAVRRRNRGKSVGSHPGGSNILHAAQEEERALEQKARDQEAKEEAAEARRQEDSVNGVKRWKTLYRSQRRSTVAQNVEAGVV